jgi:hypothetical protein
MSINSLANSAAARLPDTLPIGTTPNNLDEIAQAASTPPTTNDTTSPSAPPPNGNVETAINVLFGYIPTEIITLYVAVLGAIGVEGEVTRSEWASFWFFLFATPTVFWLVYAAKLKNANLPLPFSLGVLPIWEMVAATTSFFAWAFALPQSPFADFKDWYSPALAGVAVLITSAILGLIAPFFQRPLQ